MPKVHSKPAPQPVQGKAPLPRGYTDSLDDFDSNSSQIEELEQTPPTPEPPSTLSMVEDEGSEESVEEVPVAPKQPRPRYGVMRDDGVLVPAEDDTPGFDEEQVEESVEEEPIKPKPKYGVMRDDGTLVPAEDDTPGFDDNGEGESVEGETVKPKQPKPRYGVMRDDGVLVPAEDDTPGFDDNGEEESVEEETVKPKQPKPRYGVMRDDGVLVPAEDDTRGFDDEEVEEETSEPSPGQETKQSLAPPPPSEEEEEDEDDDDDMEEKEKEEERRQFGLGKAVADKLEEVVHTHGGCVSPADARELLEPDPLPERSYVTPYLLTVWYSSAAKAYVDREFMAGFLARRVQLWLQNDGPSDEGDILDRVGTLINEEPGSHVQLGDPVDRGIEKRLFERQGQNLALPGDELERTQSLMRGSAYDKGGVDSWRVGTEQEGSGWRVMGMDEDHVEGDKEWGLVYHDEEGQERNKLTPNDGLMLDSQGKRSKGPDLTGLTDKQVFNTSNNFGMKKLNDLAPEGTPDKEYFEAVHKVCEMIREQPRYIFVMDGKGQFHVDRGELKQTHHSTLMGGGSVAAAGELSMDNGTPVYLSDNSGHYRMPPSQTWQAVKQLELDGFDVERLEVEIYDVEKKLTGGWFLREFDPSAPVGSVNHLPQDGPRAIALINARLKNVPVEAPIGPENQPLPEEEESEVVEQESEQVEEEVQPGPRRRKKKGILGKISRWGKKVFGKKKGRA